MVDGFVLSMALIVVFTLSVIAISIPLSRLVAAILDPYWTPTPAVGVGYPYTNSKGNTYYLHLDKKLTASGKINQLYFFSRDQMENAVPLLPDGYAVQELSNGLPILKLNVARPA